MVSVSNEACAGKVEEEAMEEDEEDWPGWLNDLKGVVGVVEVDGSLGNGSLIGVSVVCVSSVGDWWAWASTDDKYLSLMEEMDAPIVASFKW